MKLLFRKKITANIKEQILLAQEHSAVLHRVLLQEDTEMRLEFARAVCSLINDTAAKFRVSQRSALFGDTLTWSQLADAIDDWNVAVESAYRLANSTVSQTARGHGTRTGHAIILYIHIYQMKFNQQQFPNILGEEVSRLFHTGTQLSELLCNLSNGTSTDEHLLKLLYK
jgi:hypothetical protein